jgi:type IV secretory pathway VirB10-like protein
MTENQQTPESREPSLATKTEAPQGVLPKDIKLYIFLGIAVLFLAATAISSLRRSPERPKAAAAVPLLQDLDTTRIDQFGRDLKQQARPESSPASGGVPPASPYLGAPASPGMPYPNPSPGAGQPPYTNANGGSPSADDQQRNTLLQEERELAFRSRFASNLAYSQGRAATQAGLALPPSGEPRSPFAANPLAPISSGAQTAKAGSEKRATEVNVNSAVGQPYVLYEGTIIDTVLMNRLDGDEAGPVKVLVTNPVYSHDREHILIPEGSIILGESRKLGAAGFGQQRRMALLFHRLLMPDGYSADLDQFQGLNQIGEAGIKDKVNNHYVQVFGTSIALGIIGGAAEISSNRAGVSANGQDALKTGVAASVSQSSTDILDKFLNIPPTITIREGHRIKVYLSQDLLLPAVENHTVPPNI